MANRSTHEWHCSPPSDQISSDTARKLTTDDDQLANEQMQDAIESSRSLAAEAWGHPQTTFWPILWNRMNDSRHSLRVSPGSILVLELDDPLFANVDLICGPHCLHYC